MQIHISNLKKQLSETDIQASKILNTIDLDLVSREELKKRYAVLADRLQGSVEKCKSLTEKLEVCQEKVIEV